MSSVLENYIKPPSSPLQQFYRRQLPQECISFCSDEGSVFGVSSKMRMCERDTGYCGNAEERRSLVHTTARETLGVILDSRLTLSAHVTALCRSGYYQLRQLRPLVQSMTVEVQEPQLWRLFPAGWIIAIRCSTGQWRRVD